MILRCDLPLIVVLELHQSDHIASQELQANSTNSSFVLNAYTLFVSSHITSWELGPTAWTSVERGAILANMGLVGDAHLKNRPARNIP